MAMSKQSNFVAARCVGRPKTVIYNPKPSNPCQDRGNVFWGWVPWVMKLTYATMLNGVPGTGTRDYGLSGLMLKVNLDGIVLIRFHHLCFRVSCLAAILYVLIVLPVYQTAQCSVVGGDLDLPKCIQQNFTAYQRLTIENVAYDLLEEDESITDFYRFFTGKFLARLYTVVVVSWIISGYTCVLLEREWRDILAMRRVYYLEADHWSDRNAELQETLLREERETLDGSMNREKEAEKNYAKTRDPWIHHPEQPDTVPNVELYSVLVGGLPGLPTEASLLEDVKAVFSRKQSIDWQLAVTSAFFDHCVPNQPGFSSSVAAVTILPAANQITEAWKHWHKTAARVRKLRFVRREIAKRKKAEERRSQTDVPYGDDTLDQQSVPQSSRSLYGKLKGKHKSADSFDEQSVPPQSNRSMYGKLKRNYTKKDKKEKKEKKKEKKRNKKKKKNSKMRPSVYIESDEKTKYFSEVLGNTDDLDVEKNLLHALKLGPEQTAVYSREFAQGAASLAPYGWNEAKVRRASLSELLVMEKIALNAVQEASNALREAQEKIAKDDIDDEVCDDKHLTDLMVSATTAGRNASSTQGDQEYVETENRKSWLDFFTKTSTSNAVERKNNGSISNGGSNTNRRSLIQNLEVIAPPPDRSNTGSSRNERRIQGEEQTRTSLVSLDDLGLEAGLFLEQKILSSGHAQHMPRHALKRSKSLDDASLFDVEEESDELSLESTEDDIVFHRRAPVRRSKSNDDVDIMQRQLRAKSSLDYDKLGYELPGAISNSRTKSIMEKIAIQNERRNQIRDRLSSISKSNDDGKITVQRKPSFSDIETIEVTNVESKNSWASNGGTVQHAGRSRIHSIDESSNTSSKMFGSDTHSIRGAPQSMKNFSMAGEDANFTLDFEEKAGLRKRQTATKLRRPSITANEKWTKVIQIANESSSRRNKNEKSESIESGSYSLFTFHSFRARMVILLKNVFDPSKWQSRSAEIVDPFQLAGESTFAVVTFTSRQAAVAARHLLADSRGTDRWNAVSEIPAPPLADAPVFNLSSFRGCVRPVTVSINDRGKMIRHILALSALGALYIFYIIPLTAVQELLSPESLQGILPNLDTWLQNDFAKYIFSGFIPALVWTGFYALCPPMFKAIANFGSNATSVADAERSALRYFWWFMIVSAFTGTSLATAVLRGGGLNLGTTFQSVIIEAASEIPSTISATWLNWIIVRVSLVLPTQYILQMNPFLFSWLRLKVLVRAVQGGGSGGPIPYRIYVDSGVVMLCLLALAPASPLIAIACLVYFLFCVPMLRWVLIFLYKPKFDIGGARFPFIFDMCVSGVLAGQILLGAMLFIRKAFGPACMAIFPFPITLFYRWVLLKKYLKRFTDVALLQTSLLDGWDTNEESSTAKREEFRQFLVDCHKAAYVPVCIASEEATVITSEPAVVVPLETDLDEDDEDMTSVHTETQSIAGGDTETVPRTPKQQTLYHPYEPQKQHGRMMRRASLQY